MTAHQKLAAFGSAVLGLLRGNTYCDDQSIQDAALAHGVLVIKTMTQPCAQNCLCRAAGFTFPLECCLVAEDVEALLPTQGVPV